jgi:hypothetical protein
LSAAPAAAGPLGILCRVQAAAVRRRFRHSGRAHTADPTFLSRNDQGPIGWKGLETGVKRRRSAVARPGRHLVRLLLCLLAQGEIRTMKFEAVARRVLAEFDEMPGLSLTPRQAARLFGLDQDVCRLILDSLVDRAYLRESGGTVKRGERIAA